MRKEMKKYLKPLGVLAYALLWVSVVFVLFLCLCGCGKTHHRAGFGYVVGKEHRDARVAQQYDPVLQIYGSRFVPEQWLVWVADSTGVRVYRVTPFDYGRAEKGMMVKYGTTQEVTKEIH